MGDAKKMESDFHPKFPSSRSSPTQLSKPVLVYFLAKMLSFVEGSDFVSEAIDIAANELLAVATSGKVDQVQLDRAKRATKSALFELRIKNGCFGRYRQTSIDIW
ncbi:putative quinol--cytochrome-c reductase, Mitochondrial processing peptidase [Lupinus albus]|uniref:Putative quinol--cytochrome-c reductase, Mitochondrial processing peptidase n=1 Tax=Lupinus albus TaxID=3870 RepID=A0A6A4QKR4_LUPAL|nr:putative quinol--cytochrome-c reductase, Mitochondrial processing peptidase [Lupinus albus]